MNYLPESHKYDLIVVGGTPGGLAAAIAAARRGRSVALVEYHSHLGGTTSSGVGKSDIDKRDMIGGLFREFVQRVRRHYLETYGADSDNFKLCRDGYYYEPSVAEAVFESMIAEQPNIDVCKECMLTSVDVDSGRVCRVEVVDRSSQRSYTLSGRIFIDATYEGDLFAMAGAGYRVGRESRDEFGEPHAGVVYCEFETGQLLPGTTGEGDDRCPAYTYRLCFSTDPQNGRALNDAPPGYDRNNYVAYFDDLKAGRLGPPRRMVDGLGYYPAHFNTIFRAFSVTELPNRKVDANINPRALAFPFPEENVGYAEGDWSQRELICRRHRELTLGLIYFCQNDAQIPVEQREIAQQYLLPADEFTDNDNFPFQLYVREARRLRGLYTLTEHDVMLSGEVGRSRRHDDAVAVGEFPIDSFPVRKRRSGDSSVLEGYLGVFSDITRPYQIPYRIMIPESLDGVIVPVAASATHVAFSSLRMEPTWMALGHAAGLAAHVAIQQGCSPRNVSIETLQDLLIQEGQVLKTSDGGSLKQKNEFNPKII